MKEEEVVPVLGVRCNKIQSLTQKPCLLFICSVFQQLHHVSASTGCCNKLPPVEWLKAKRTYSLTVLGISGLKGLSSTGCFLGYLRRIRFLLFLFLSSTQPQITLSLQAFSHPPWALVFLLFSCRTSVITQKPTQSAQGNVSTSKSFALSHPQSPLCHAQYHIHSQFEGHKGGCGGTLFYLTSQSVLEKTRTAVLRFSLLIVQLWMGNAGSGVFLPVVVRVDTEQTKLMFFFFLFPFVLAWNHRRAEKKYNVSDTGSEDGGS